MDILREISTDTDFDDIRLHYRLQGEPIFKAFGCTVIERKTNSGYAYVVKVVTLIVHQKPDK